MQQTALPPVLSSLLTPDTLPGRGPPRAAATLAGPSLVAAERPATPDIGSLLASMPPAPGPAPKKSSKAAAAVAAPAPSPSSSLLSPDGQPLCPTTPSATYQCVPYGFSPDAAPALSVCVNLCAAPPPPGSDSPLCVNCGDPSAACRRAHGEYGQTFTFALTGKGVAPCYVKPPPPGEGDAACATNTGSNNKGCGNQGSNNVGNGNVGDGNQGDGNKGSFNIGDKNTGSYNRGACNRGDGNQGSNLAGNYLVGNGNNPCPLQ